MLVGWKILLDCETGKMLLDCDTGLCCGRPTLSPGESPVTGDHNTPGARATDATHTELSSHWSPPLQLGLGLVELCACVVVTG